MTRLVRRIILCTSFLTISLHANEIHELPDWDVFGDLQDMEENMTIDPDFLSTMMINEATRALPVSQVMEILQPIQSQLCTILTAPFYKKTNLLNSRSLLDLPIFEIHMATRPRDWIVGASLFWNHTDRMVFTCESTNISSYLALFDPVVINALKEAVTNPQLVQIANELCPGFAQKAQDLLGMLPGTIGLFENFTVQQRRVGFMFQGWLESENFDMHLFWPFYYLERNIFARPTEQAAIERRFGVLNAEEQKQFEDNHAVSDQVGFGDLRFEGLYPFIRWDHFQWHAGIQLTLPIAFAVYRGIKGTTFDDNLCQPTLDLEPFLATIPMDSVCDPNGLDPVILAQAQALLVGDICRNKNGLALAALDRFNAIVLDENLGNGRHVGIGPVIRSRTLMSAFLEEYDWAYKFSFNNRLSFEYLTPAYETRFFARRTPASDCNDLDFNDTSQATANFEYLENQLVQKFFPYALRTLVQPGIIARWLSRACYCGTVWDFNLGTDFWVQGKEKLKGIEACETLYPSLDTDDAISPFASQSKIFTGLGYKVIREHYECLLGINAEGTWWSTGIGYDYTVALNIEANF